MRLTAVVTHTHTRAFWATTRYFMLPHYGKEGVDTTGYQSPASVSQTLPIRLVDYFVSGPPDLEIDIFACWYFATGGVDMHIPNVPRQEKSPTVVYNICMYMMRAIPPSSKESPFRREGGPGAAPPVCVCRKGRLFILLAPPAHRCTQDSSLDSAV